MPPFWTAEATVPPTLSNVDDEPVEGAVEAATVDGRHVDTDGYTVVRGTSQDVLPIVPGEPPHNDPPTPAHAVRHPALAHTLAPLSPGSEEWAYEQSGQTGNVVHDPGFATDLMVPWDEPVHTWRLEPPPASRSIPTVG